MKYITREEFCNEYPNCIKTLEAIEKTCFKSQVIMVPEGMVEMTKAYQELKATANTYKWKLFGGCMFLFHKKNEAMQFRLSWEH